MKHNILSPIFLLCLCFAFQSVRAQLEVQSNYNVKIDRTMSIGTDRDPYARLNIEVTSNEQYNTCYGVKAHIKTRNTMPTGPVIGLYGYADGSPSLSNYPITPMVGVFGKAYMSQYATNRFSAGVVGVANIYGGFGVYGAIASSYNYVLPTTNNIGAYAGYFAGNVNVTATLTAASISSTSDARLKKNIRNLNDSATTNLQRLHPVEYKLKEDSIHCLYEKDATEMKINHYGLLAQELQEVFPNLVYESKDGYLSINYTELIPVLIKSVQELSSEVEKLKGALQDQSLVINKKNINQDQCEAKLYQNNPNPFSLDTKIAYQLPSSTKRSALYIYNMNGQQVAEYPITIYGAAYIIISAGTLEAGMYLYSLIADGQIIDTKRMILTK